MRFGPLFSETRVRLKLECARDGSSQSESTYETIIVNL